MVGMQVSPGSQVAGTWTCPSVSTLKVRLSVATCIRSLCFRDFRENSGNFSPHFTFASFVFKLTCLVNLSTSLSDAHVSRRQALVVKTRRSVHNAHFIKTLSSSRLFCGSSLMSHQNFWCWASVGCLRSHCVQTLPAFCDNIARDSVTSENIVCYVFFSVLYWNRGKLNFIIS